MDETEVGISILLKLLHPLYLQNALYQQFAL